MTRPLTDRAALDRQRARARATGDAALFLQEEAADEIQERLMMVNRRFTAPAVVTAWPDLWRARLPEAAISPDLETLSLEPGAHDLVIHAMSLHWADDPVGQLIQARRALKPDGLFLGALFGGQTLTELRGALAEAEAAVTGGLSPRVAPMAEIRDVGALMQRAGFALPVADNLPKTVSYADPLRLMRDLRAMGETNAMTERPRRFTRRAVLLEAARRYVEAFGTEDGRIPATFEIILLTGWAPGPDQPEPLRPGSATQSLADALGTTETKLRN
ncbi:methyltransferase domain-containing protein [Psychromarinibacter sp. C21-152]|uniref:Methyltransferase domain-containing protein n=1 Tax=Psychromarinibacter sediminicola TaxID=3033385 RepID=A0AAE3NVW4_9RHOB|nr:methyltransferase domain-containing protein [Psychromarinibacter sediminicola]MDF0601607.1 methyltransferase domain-containing protein [Psychromarinibacter sediminicola]